MSWVERFEAAKKANAGRVIPPRQLTWLDRVSFDFVDHPTKFIATVLAIYGVIVVCVLFVQSRREAKAKNAVASENESAEKSADKSADKSAEKSADKQTDKQTDERASESEDEATGKVVSPIDEYVEVDRP